MDEGFIKEVRMVKFMARAKKDGRRINFFMKTAIADLLDKYCDEVGQTKTEATERILKLYLEQYYSYKDQRESEAMAE